VAKEAEIPTRNPPALETGSSRLPFVIQPVVDVSDNLKIPGKVLGSLGPFGRVEVREHVCHTFSREVPGDIPHAVFVHAGSASRLNEEGIKKKRCCVAAFLSDRRKELCDLFPDILVSRRCRRFRRLW